MLVIRYKDTAFFLVCCRKNAEPPISLQKYREISGSAIGLVLFRLAASLLAVRVLLDDFYF